MSKIGSIDKAFFGLAAVVVCGVVLVWITIGYVAMHFISKFW